MFRDAKKDNEKKVDKSEVGGHKAWVMVILIISILVSLLFALKSHRPEFSSPSFSFQLPAVNLNLFGTREYNF